MQNHQEVAMLALNTLGPSAKAAIGLGGWQGGHTGYVPSSPKPGHGSVSL